MKDYKCKRKCFVWDGLNLGWVAWPLIGVMVFSVICIGIVFLQECFSGQWNFNWRKEGIACMLDFWREYKPLFVALFSASTLLVAMISLKKYIDVETCRCLSDLRSKFNMQEKKEIHNFLLEEMGPIVPELEEISDKSGQIEAEERVRHSNIEIFDYLGTIELGAIMLERSVITKKEFENQFDCRIKNYWANDKIRGYLQKENKYYSKFFSALESLGEEFELT